MSLRSLHKLQTVHVTIASINQSGDLTWCDDAQKISTAHEATAKHLPHCTLDIGGAPGQDEPSTFVFIFCVLLVYKILPARMLLSVQKQRIALITSTFMACAARNHSQDY